MQKRNRFVGVLTAILVGFLVAVGVQAFTNTTKSTNTQTPGQSPVATIPVKQVTFEPAPDLPTATALPMLVASPLPTLPAVQYDTVPTSEPIPSVPAPVSLAANEMERYANDFSTTELTNWQYGQVFWDPLPAPEWSVQSNDYIQDVLVAPENSDTIASMSDTMAFPDVSLDGDGGIEVTALAGYAEKVGLVLGNVADQDYIVAIFSTTDASGVGQTGFSLVRLTGESRAVLYHEATPVIDGNTWYRLRMESDADMLHISLDGEELLAFPLAEDLSITDVGLFAGSDGYAYFDDLRVFSK